MELPSALLRPSSKKKTHPEKISYISKEWNFLASRLKNSLYFRKWNFLALILRNFLYFLKRNLFYISGNGAFCILRNGNPPKIPYISRNGTFLYLRKLKPWKKNYVSGNRNPKKLFIFEEVTFWARKNPILKNFLYLGKCKKVSKKKVMNNFSKNTFG